MEKVITDKSLNFATYETNHSTYQYVKRQQVNGSSSISVDTAGGGMLEITVPGGNCWNLSKSYFSFYSSTPTCGAGKHNWNYATGAAWVQSLEIVGEKSGTIIEKVNYVNRAVEFFERRQTSADEVIANDCPGVSTTTPNAMTGVFEGLAMTTNNQYRPDNTLKSLGDTSTLSGGGNIEPSYLVAQGTHAGVLNMLHRIPLKIFKNTFLAKDADLYFPETVLIRIILAPSTQMGFVSTVSGTITPGTVEAIASTITLTNFYLFLCNITNPAIKQKLTEQVMGSGLSFQFNHSHNSALTLNGTDVACNIKITPGVGKAIRQFNWAPYNPSTTGAASNRYYDHSNLSGASAGTKVSSVYTLLNGNRLSPQTYTESAGDSYFETRDKLKGSCIGTLNQYLYNYGLTYDFASNNNMLEKPVSIDESNFADGIPIGNGDLTFEVMATQSMSGNILNHMTYVVVSKVANFTKEGIFVSN